MTWDTRRAGPSDAEGIASAHGDSIRTIGSRYYPPEVVEQWAAGLTADLYRAAMAQGEVFFVATDPAREGPQVLGFSAHHSSEGHRIAVYVRGAASRRGIASTLFRLAERSARDSGAECIDVDASLAAVEFYRAHGFEELGRGEHRLRSGATMACVFMRKILIPDYACR
jgi:putative acetyltransferase